MHIHNGAQPELFCLAVAESQVAGVLPISTDAGALETTNMGVVIKGDARDPATQRVFVDKTIEYLKNPSLPDIQRTLKERAIERFSLDKILKEWQEKVFQ